MNNFRNYITDSSRVPVKLSTGRCNIGDNLQLMETFLGYEKGDCFTIIQTDRECEHIRLGGIGEYSFIDKNNKKICVHVGPSVIDRVFEQLITEPSSVSTMVMEQQASQAYPIAERVIVERIVIQEGVKGDAGQRGIQGYTGATGATGSAGEKGNTGDTGPMGDRGEPGPTGATGAIGLQGERGEQGIVGNTGPRGDTGSEGKEGPQGIKGEQGEQGLAGVNGENGRDGIDGEQGAQGIQGIQGLQGERGLDGKDGLAGIPGPAGINGEAGPIGIQGQRGDTGDVGVATVSYPLKIENDHLSVEQKFFEDLIGNATKGVSPQGGGGGIVAVLKDDEKVSSAIRSINFTDNIEVTKEGINRVSVGVNMAINDLSDTIILSETLATDNVLKYNGTNWINAVLPDAANPDIIGEVTTSGKTAVVVNDAVISKVLTGFTSSSGAVASTDTILQAIQKLSGNSVEFALLDGGNY